MSEEAVLVGDEEEAFLPNQVCVAEQDFNGQEAGDLTFTQGEVLTIVRQAEMAFWYVAKNAAGLTGLVPKTYLIPLHHVTNSYTSSHCPTGSESEVDPALDLSSFMSWSGTDFLEVQATIDEDLLHTQQREAQRRLPPGTLVVATCQFVAQSNEDMSFNMYEEMTLLKPMDDLCWYYAQKACAPSERGAIPITHVKLVYVSDEEGDEGNYKVPKVACHSQLYENRDEFIKLSGWYSHVGLPPTKEALLHVLARKANLSYEDFVTTMQAVYMMQYMNHEKVYVGKAEVLHRELSKHFECFGKPRDQIRGIDDELCHHTDAAGWTITIWPLQDNQVLEVEWNKKIVEQGTLQSSEESGMNELVFTSMDSWDQFGKWFWPN